MSRQLTAEQRAALERTAALADEYCMGNLGTKLREILALGRVPSWRDDIRAELDYAEKNPVCRTRVLVRDGVSV